jgi:hypothetical protein
MDAERLVLRGAKDHGDVRVTKQVHIEVKSGKAAEDASAMQIGLWMIEAEVEGMHSGTLCFLVTKKRAVGTTRVGQWRAFLRADQVNPELHDTDAAHYPVELSVEGALLVLAALGKLPMPNIPD